MPHLDEIHPICSSLSSAGYSVPWLSCELIPADLLDSPRDPIPVQRAQGLQGLDDHQTEGAVENVTLVGRHLLGAYTSQLLAVNWSDVLELILLKQLRDSPKGPALLFAHERVLVVARRRERFLDRPRADPSHEVQLRAGLVVRARRARAAERLLADDRACGLVVDVEVAGGVAQRARGLPDGARDRGRTPLP